MHLFTIILFFIYLWGLGFTVTRFAKKPKNSLEANLMNIGIGLAVFVVLGVFLNLLHIPLDWKVFLCLSAIFPVFYFIKFIGKKETSQIRFKFTKSNIYIVLVLLMFLFSFYMYHKGAFAYPYLEDDDPWSHAIGVKYVSIEKTVYVPKNEMIKVSYMDAYPPGYDLIFGVLHQTSPDLMWTMKFFNALIISFGIIFFYFFIKHFTRNSSKALFSTFVLVMIPCYLSHFIWSHALIPTLFFVSIYCLEQMRRSKSWFFVSAIAIAAIPLIQPTQPVKLGVLFVIYWAVKAILQKRFMIRTIGAISLGYAISAIIWWVPMLFKYGSGILTKGLNYAGAMAGGSFVEKSGIIGPLGSATRLYTFNDFFFAKSQNMINNPVGVGAILCLLLVIAVFFLIFRYKSFKIARNNYQAISLLWLLFTFLGLFGGTLLPIAFISFRFWMLFAIPVSILASEGVWFLFAIGKSIKIKKWMIVIVLVVLIWFTSGQQKFAVNTAQWGPGGWFAPAPGALNSYIWMKQNFPANTPVFAFSRLGSMALGFSLYSCEWCPDVKIFRKELPNKSVEEVNNWLKSKDYDYVMIDEYYMEKNGLNKTIEMMDDMISSDLFTLLYQPQYNGQKLFSFVFKINK